MVELKPRKVVETLTLYTTIYTTIQQITGTAYITRYWSRLPDGRMVLRYVTTVYVEPEEKEERREEGGEEEKPSRMTVGVTV